MHYREEARGDEKDLLMNFFHHYIRKIDNPHQYWMHIKNILSLENAKLFKKAENRSDYSLTLHLNPVLRNFFLILFDVVLIP